MENASKALIIAGAILISILLIGVGITVMNSISEPVDEAAGAASGQAVEIFNSKFTPYIGTDIGVATAKQFFATVTSVAASGDTMTAEDDSISVADLSAKDTYKINISDSDTDGKYDKYKVEKTTTTVTP